GSGDSSEAQIQKQGALRLAILFLGPVLLWVYQQTVIPELQTKRSQLLSEIESLREFNRGAERSVNEIKRFKEDEERIQARIAYLDGISKNRNREIKIIELIQQVIPEKSWLNRLEFNGGKV